MIRDVLAPNPGPFTLHGTRTWLVGDSMMIDPGPEIASHVDALLAAQPGVTHILLTHRHADHAPAAVPLARRTGARIFAPEGVLDDAEVHARIGEGSVITAGGETIRTIATPGHTSEHVCFFTDHGDLFSGDTILGEGTSAIFPPDGNMKDYLESLERLRSLAPRRIFPAHGPVREDAVEWISYYIEHRRGRETEIGATLEAGPMSIPELRAAIYPELHPALREAAEGQILAHLQHMEWAGRISWDGTFAQPKNRS